MTISSSPVAQGDNSEKQIPREVNMKSCSLNDFINEITPWLDKDYIQAAGCDDSGHFVLQFLDGTKNVYIIDDCNQEQVTAVLDDLKGKGITIIES